MFRRACELAAGAAAVERVGVWLFIDDRTVLRCANLFEQSKDEHSAGTLLRVADFPNYFASLSLRKAIPAEVAVAEPWTAELAAEYLEPLGIGSALDAGVFLDGQLVGVVCLEHVGAPREWTTEDRDFAGSVADLLALRIQSAEARESRAAFLIQDDRPAARDENAALEQLAAGVAHDFRNLLTICLGHGELLSTRTDLPADARQQAREIVAVARRGTELARELMDFVRPETTPTALDLAAATGEFLPVLRAAVSTRYALDYVPTAVGRVLIEKGQFTRLLLNLAINVSEAMPDGGPIVIRLALVKLTDDPSYLGRFVLLEVSDTGTGIDEATQRRIFEPFFTTKSKGTGLGLAIVRRVVDRVGGLTRIESAPGRGTTFRVFFPRMAVVAVGHYRAARALRPDHPAVLTNLGLLLGDVNEPAAAVTVLKEAVRLHPNDHIAHFNLGGAYIRQQKYKDAETAYRAAIKFSPNYAAAHSNLGVTPGRSGNGPGALVAIREAARLAPNDVRVRVNFGLALQKTGDLPGAIREYRRAVELDKEYAPAHFNLGAALGISGDEAGRTAGFREAARLDPKMYGELLKKLPPDG